MDSLVTAVITTYGRKPELLKRALESALNQSYKNIEVIVTDDNGINTDIQKEVASFIESYGDRVKYLPLEKNSGACVARNVGLEIAKGEYIAFLDDDDEWVENKIEEQVKFLNGKSEYGMVYCNDWIIFPKKKMYRKRKNPSEKIFFDELMWSNFIGGTSMPLMRTGICRKVGGFDELMESSQDYDLWIRISKISKVGHVAMPLVNYYAHSGERITNNPSKKINGMKRMKMKNQEYFDSHPRIDCRSYWEPIPYYIMWGKRNEARKLWFQMIKKYPLSWKMNLKFFFVSMIYSSKTVKKKMSNSTRI